MSLKNKFPQSAILLAALCYAALPAYSDPVVSQAQAATAAQEFSRSIAVPGVDAANAPNASQSRFPVASEHHNADKSLNDLANEAFLALFVDYPHGYWRIERPGQYHMEVDDVTGHILGYVCYISADVDGNLPAGEAIPKSQARQIAEAALRATGAPLNNYTFAYTQERQDYSPPTASGHEWYVCWNRTFQGIPYRREGAGVFLAAETGKVISVRVDEQSIDPPTADGSVSQAQALNMATAQLEAAGITASEMPSVTAEKEIVPFNHYWETGDEAHRSLQTDVVWNCRYTLPGETLEVWIGADTGDVIGGYYTGTLGRGGKLPIPKFGHQLKHTELTVKGK